MDKISLRQKYKKIRKEIDNKESKSKIIIDKIINSDFGTEFVYENESAVVFKDINPQADIHLLVVLV